MQNPDVNEKPSLCIGMLGADWWGSDARAMGAVLRKDGHILIERHYEDFLSTKWRSLPLRMLRRAIRGTIAAEYNRSVAELLQIDALCFLLVFKGMLLSRKTLQRFRDAGTPCYCVYPDVSFQDHGTNIWDCLPLYDCVFTTKSYHLLDDQLQDHVRDLRYVPHGYDPEVHRPIPMNQQLLKNYGCDISFVGVWSPKKERILAALLVAMPELTIRIWGPFWDRACATVQARWQKRSAYGDELAAICSGTRINLGLLSEAGGGTHSGDQTTARTWQIPACGGFLLHEDTHEVRESFRAGEEIAVFGTEAELVEMVRKYLADEALRDQVRQAGFQRCMSSAYTYRNAVDKVLAYHHQHASATQLT